MKNDDYGCYGKKKFKTYYEASRNAKRMKRHVNKIRINVYRCKTCHYWHTGNTLNNKKEVREWVM